MLISEHNHQYYTIYCISTFGPPCIWFSRMVCFTSVTRHIQALGVYPPRVKALNSYNRIIHVNRIFLLFHIGDEEQKNLFLDERIIGCGDELEAFQIADLKKRLEYKKQGNRRIAVVTYHLIYALYFVKITSPKGSSWLAIHSGNCDRKLPITSQQKVISGCFVPWYITNVFQ